MDVDNGNLWAALVAAEREAANLRASIHGGNEKLDMLANALDVRANAWDQRTAMNYLRSFPSEVGNFTSSLFQLAMGGRWESLARDILRSGRRAEVGPEISRLALDFIPTSDPQDYVQLASLLAALEAGVALRELAADARRNEEPTVREAGALIDEHYHQLISSGHNTW